MFHQNFQFLSSPRINNYKKNEEHISVYLTNQKKLVFIVLQYALMKHVFFPTPKFESTKNKFL